MVKSLFRKVSYRPQCISSVAGPPSRRIPACIAAMALGAGALGGVQAFAQTPTPTPHRKTASRQAMAAWTPDVQQAFGVQSSEFASSGLSRLTSAQLTALIAKTKADPRKHILTCPANGTTPSGMLHVLVTVAGEDSTGTIAGAIRSAVGSLSGVTVVSDPAGADRALHVVLQEQTMGKRTIGFTAAYVTSTPCGDTFQGKTTDVELKQQLGTYTDPKGPDLARDLAGMMDQDLQALRKTSAPIR